MGTPAPHATVGCTLPFRPNEAMLKEIHRVFREWAIRVQIDAANKENAVSLLFTDDRLARQPQPVLQGHERAAARWSIQALHVCWFRTRCFRGGAGDVHLGSFLYSTCV